MTFNEANTVEQMILDAATKQSTATPKWTYVFGAQVPRSPTEVIGRVLGARGADSAQPRHCNTA